LPAIRTVEDTVAGAAEPEMHELPRLDPDLSNRPAVAEPKAEPGASGAKEAGAKKSRRYADYDRQAGWFGYR
jgi:hypothetical protein